MSSTSTSNIQKFFEDTVDPDVDPMEDHRKKTISEREDEYHSHRTRMLSPERVDAFDESSKRKKKKEKRDSARSYSDIMKESNVLHDEDRFKKKLQEKEVDAFLSKQLKKRNNRWDQKEEYDTKSAPKKSKWDETPLIITSDNVEATPISGGGVAFPSTPLSAAQRVSIPGLTPEQLNKFLIVTDDGQKSRILTNDELDQLLPTEGYAVIEPPTSYKPILSQVASNSLQNQPTAYQLPIDRPKESYGINLPNALISADLPPLKTEDIQYFAPILNPNEQISITKEQRKINEILELLLRIKNGEPAQRKFALKLLNEKARSYGPALLFNHVLPLLMSPTLEDQERHLMVKVIDKLLYKLDDLVRPYVHKILVVIEPLLIEEDYYARVEGREIISNLSKAAGLATMIATLRPDLDSTDEYVRNTTARAFSVVASALGISSILPFLKAVCQSKKSWEARHTGIKIVQQIALLVGCAVLPHLKSLVEIIQNGLVDDQTKVKTIAALAIAALAEAASPYGIECFDEVLKPLWRGVHEHRGKTLAAFLKAIGFIIPLMDASYANYYTKEVMPTLVREFASPDEEMKKIVLRVVHQCVSTQGVSSEYIKSDILPEFFRNFWVRRMALDKRNYRAVVDTSVELARRTGGSEIITRIVEALKDQSEPYRKMVMETIDRIMTGLGGADIHTRLEELLIDGILYAFQEQSGTDDIVMLNGFGVVVNTLGTRCKPYLPQIASIVKFRLNNKNPRTRQQSADLIARIATVMQICGEDKLMGHLGVVLYEYLGEEYPEVLGSILGALKAIVNVIGMTKMTPPIKDLLPRLTPILKNRHEKVQENCIDLVGRIADRGAEFVGQREWMRVCFELLEMLNAHKKAIRRAAVNTFGYIAKAIGPQDVLNTLLNNLRVQERRNRVCTCVAIAIVAETCAPFTVLPALMNEYRVPEMNVQNGVLKAMSFIFEYIGEMARDYAYAICSLLTDGLIDRDLVHRQTACTTIQHLAIDIFGMGCEDLLIHLLNHIWPNILETSPHVINAVTGAVDAIRVSAGPAIIMQYLLQGLFHPSRKDAIVAMYPSFTNEASPDSIYNRSDLSVFI